MVCQQGGNEQQLSGWAPGFLSPSNALAERRQGGRSPGDLAVTQEWLLIAYFPCG